VKPKFLLDENLSPKLQNAVRKYNSKIDILRVGDLDAPLLGTLDSDLLIYLEVSQRILITDNRSTIPAHLDEHWQAGRYVWGVIWLRPSGTINEWLDSIILIWEVTEAEEWINKLDWIPF
jgi:hypothetical protein